MSSPESQPSPSAAPDASALAVALTAISARLAAEPDDAEVGARLVAEVQHLLRADGVHLALLDSDPAWLVVRHAAGTAAPAVGTRQLSDADLVGQAVQRGEAVLGGTVAAPGGSAVAVPLRFKGELLGALQAMRAAAAPPFATTDQLGLQLLADLAAARIGAATRSAALRERARELATLAPAWRPAPEDAGDAVLVYDATGHIVDVDEACCRLLEYPRKSLLGRALWDVSPFPPGMDRAEVARTQVEQARAGPLTFETTAQRHDGSLLPLRVRVEACSSPSGPVLRGIAHDISAQKQAQLRALEVEKMRLLAEIGSGLAHEINSPLAVVLGNAEMLLDEALDDAQRSLIGSMRDAALRIAAAVQSVQRFMRPAGTWTPIDLSALAWETVELTRPIWWAEPRSQGRLIRLHLEINSSRPVRANPVELQTALRELIANSVQALPHGGTIVVRVDEAGGDVLLSVTDDGIGMTEEVRRRCTDPFFTTRRPGGTGLGLNRVYDVTLRHYGKLRVDSEAGKGTTVTMSLPLLPERPQAQ